MASTTLPLAAFYVPTVLAVAGTAAILDRAQPAHLLRWLALVFFLVGFHFDFLAA